MRRSILFSEVRFLALYIVRQYMLSCFSTTMSSTPVLDGEPEEMEIEIEIPLDEVCVIPCFSAVIVCLILIDEF